MAVIPKGLRADYMRKRMEDKSAMNVTGGLYMGGTTSITLNNATTTISAKATEILVPGESELALQSQESGSKLVYSTVGTAGFADSQILRRSLGAGTVVGKNDGDIKKTLAITVSGDDIIIEFLATE